MAKHAASADIQETARILARLGDVVVVPIYIDPSRALFREHRKSHIEALKLFLWAYAFERAGAPQSYRTSAIRALEKCADFWSDKDIPNKIWIDFSRRLGPTKANPARNPLYPKNSSGSINYNAVDFCKNRLQSDGQNLYLFSFRNISADKVRAAHDGLRRIRGIGPKIASLFLRDIALENRISDRRLRDRHLLQPIDVWLRRAAETLTGSDLRDEQASRELVDIADTADCCAMCLNAGSWYFGSQVVRSEKPFRESLRNPQALLCNLERHRRDLIERGEWLLEEAKRLSALSGDGRQSG